MKRVIILILLVITLVNCSENNNTTASSDLMIRLSNVSQFDFENIVVNTSTGNVNFENISSNQNSEYKTFELAYRYAFVELEIDGEVYTFQPIDYVGETSLENRKYTYEIDINPQSQYERITISLIVE